MAEHNKEKSNQRSPIVAVMGHVDHGKTTLLDYIRKTNIASREAGGITQSIGAYEIIHASHESQTDADGTQTNAENKIGQRQVRVRSASSPRESAFPEGKKITFIDTPGHEVFSKMRSRGAHIADLAILVVAADEGVKPQTKESVKILEETKTPFVVAITKIDKPNADVEKIKNELTAAGVFLEGYGGQISYQPISSKTGEGIDELLDLILLTAEMENLSYEPAAPASGYVLEAKVDRRRGLEATLIVKNGILRAGDFISTPTIQGKIKILENFLGEPAKEIAPSAPALVIGFETLPQAGEEFSAVGAMEKISFSEIQKKPWYQNLDEETKTLRLILKASDSGSLEALSGIVKSFTLSKSNGLAPSKPATNSSNGSNGLTPPAGGEKPINPVRSSHGALNPEFPVGKQAFIPAAETVWRSASNGIKIVDESVGDVNDNDVKLAISSHAIIVSFKSRADKTSKNLAEINGVKIISSEIIYELLKAIEDYLKELEAPKPTGTLKILAVFSQSNPQKQIIGGEVESGIFKNKASFEVEREGKIIGSGRTLNLQQQKKDAAEVGEGKEAGLLVSSDMLLKTGDSLLIKAKPNL